MKETSIIKHDDDGDRSSIHRLVREIIKYDDDDGDRSSIHRLVKEASIIKYDDDNDGDRNLFHKSVKETSIT